MKEYKTTISVLAICMVLAACTNGQKNECDEASDSLAVHEPTLEELTLPDTAFASTEAVTFVVDIADSSANNLKDFDDRYAKKDRVCAFRANLMRNADFGGRVEGEPDTVIVDWTFRTAEDYTQTNFGTWGGGTGWTGQPLFDGTNIIVASLCGRIYFIDYKTGEAAREPLYAGNVLKGTPSLDPEYPNLYVGHGVPNHSPFGQEVYDLESYERTCFISRDTKAWRGWGAFDSSPIVAGGYLFWAGENGTIYKYVRAKGNLQRVAALRYKVGGRAPGMESSICVYRNYGFCSDNHGNILAVNLNTMRPVWYYNNHDDSDGTIVCREEEGTPDLYAACEVDKQGMNGTCHFVKLCALNGQLVWDCKIPCARIQLGEKILDGGVYCTPLVGSGDCEKLAFFNICRNSAAPTRGEFVAVNTDNGTVVYSVPLRSWAWSSPIAFHNEEGKTYIFTGDASGNIYLIRGHDGKVLYTQRVGNNFESSPIAVGNTAVVGSRGNGIYKFSIK